MTVDLNSLMWGLEGAIHDGCERVGDQRCAARFARARDARRAAMDRYLWDSALGAYVDFRWRSGTRIERISAATFYPLFVGSASDGQAQAVAARAAGELLRAGGIVASGLSTGEQWDAPNGWAPLQWIAVSGLLRYQHNDLARTVACRFMGVVERVFKERGALLEKYDVIEHRPGGGGEYPLQDGFGWTNGVIRKLLTLYPDCG